MADYLSQLPNEGHGEARRIAKHVGVSSTFVSLMLAGKKLLTPEQAELLTEYLGLTGLEAEYFFFLVQRERAGTSRLKSYCTQRLNEIKQKSLSLANRVHANKTITDHEKSIFYSNSLYSAAQLFTSTAEGGKTADEIAKRFQISRGQAAEIISFLLSAGLVAETETGFKVGTQNTHLAAGSPDLLRHHANWRLRAIQASEDLKKEELMYTVNVSLSRADFALLREKLVGHIKEFLDVVHASPADDIACFNLDFFWIRK